ncbi:MAG TPA: glycosyltransferase family 39 protein [Pseudogracilibacillus sp.]|nr:glycosyltransferase family 39 protein [Pseudogracilibacillus sp.]
MDNLKFNFNNKKILIPLVILMLSVFIGFLTTKFAIDSPFSDFSNNVLLDIIKVSSMILIFSFVIYTISFKVSKKILTILLIAYFLRVLMVFIMSFFGLLPYLYDNNWELDALHLLDDWNIGDFHFTVAGSTVSFYSIVTTIIYYLLGYNPIYMQLINAFVSTLSVFYFYKIAEHIFKHKIAIFSSLLMGIWPTYIYFSSMQMREAFAIFFILALLYNFIIWMSTFKIKHLFLVGLFFVLSFLIRSQNASLMIIILFPFITYFAWMRSSKYMKVLIIFIVTILIGIATALLFSLGYGEYMSMQYIENEMSYRSGGGSGYLTWMHYNSILHVILYAPLRFIYFVFSPFPWQIASIEQILAFGESVLLIYMSFKILKNLKYIWNYCINKKALFFIITFCLLGLIANGIIDSNVGTTIRHKLQYIFVIFLLYSVVSKIKLTSEKQHNNV